MAKQHINNKGEINPCYAKFICPFGGVHFDNREQMQAYYDVVNEEIQNVINGKVEDDRSPFNKDKKPAFRLMEGMSEQEQIIEKIKRLKKITTSEERLRNHIKTEDNIQINLSTSKIANKANIKDSSEIEKDIQNIRDGYISDYENQLKTLYPNAYNEYKSTIEPNFARTEKTKEDYVKTVLNNTRKYTNDKHFKASDFDNL